MLLTFILIMLLVSSLGFLARRWRPGDLNRLQEWGLAGRRFGTISSWFLLGGDIYTSYTFIAIPGLIFGQGAMGFFSTAGIIVMYPIVYLVYPRFWTVARHRGYISPVDFVRERFDSKGLALLVSITGIVATMPFLALQLYAIEVSLSYVGVPVEASLIIAFLILSAYTYTSGLRASGLTAIAKDILVFFVIISAIIVIPMKLGGFTHIFAVAPPAKILLQPQQYLAFSTLAIGTSLSLFLFPHNMTGMLCTNSRKVLQRNAALLPLYTILNIFFTLLGFAAFAAQIQPSPLFKSNAALPALFVQLLPPWFVGIAFATITIGALVPAGVMSIATANLFTRNIWSLFRPDCTDQEETNVAKTVSLLAKVGALAVVLLLPATFAANFFLLGGALIVQLVPSIVLGLYTNWFHRYALIIGWTAGVAACLLMSISQHFQQQVYTFVIGGQPYTLFIGIVGLFFNLLLVVVLTPLLTLFGVPRGRDMTSPDDYREVSRDQIASEQLRQYVPQQTFSPLSLKNETSQQGQRIVR
ncbi:MAG: sodium:solute symporter [Chloroflexi bacterium]|nr:sodium:solute symporter [Chloroflexota bacterium]